MLLFVTITYEGTIMGKMLLREMVQGNPVQNTGGRGSLQGHLTGQPRVSSGSANHISGTQCGGLAFLADLFTCVI